MSFPESARERHVSSRPTDCPPPRPRRGWKAAGRPLPGCDARRRGRARPAGGRDLSPAHRRASASRPGSLCSRLSAAAPASPPGLRRRAVRPAHGARDAPAGSRQPPRARAHWPRTPAHLPVVRGLQSGRHASLSNEKMAINGVFTGPGQKLGEWSQPRGQAGNAFRIPS